MSSIVEVARHEAVAPLRVVILGGGFGGLAVARELARARRRSLRRPLHVTLVDRQNHHTFQPLLYQVATAGLQPQDIGISLRAILRRRRRVEVRLGEVTAVDAEDRRLHLADGSTLAYDRLVVAAGAITEYYGTPGVAEHAFTLKSLADATALRNQVLRCFERASAQADGTGVISDGDLATLTFVVAGGGPTGVELAGALAELVRLVLRRDHPDLDVSRVRIVLVEPRERLLAGFSARSSRAALRGLERRGVDVRLGVGIREAGSDHVVLTDDEVVATRTLVWSAGVGASPVARTLGVELGPGRRIPVDDHLRVRGLDEVYAIGDVAAASDADGRLLPQVAPVAIQQGRYLARRLVAELRRGERTPDRRTRRPFRYRDKGSMATVGRANAVVELPGGLRIGGFVGWVAWLLLHLLQLVGFKNRTSVLLSWIWNYVAYDHAARLILDQHEADSAETVHGRVPRRRAGAGGSTRG